MTYLHRYKYVSPLPLVQLKLFPSRHTHPQLFTVPNPAPQFLPVHCKVRGSLGLLQVTKDGEVFQVCVEYFVVRETEKYVVFRNNCKLCVCVVCAYVSVCVCVCGVCACVYYGSFANLACYQIIKSPNTHQCVRVYLPL